MYDGRRPVSALLKPAEHILDSKTGEFDPSAFNDRCEEAVVALLRSKQPAPAPKKGREAAAKPRNVINLMIAQAGANAPLLANAMSAPTSELPRASPKPQAN